MYERNNTNISSWGSISDFEKNLDLFISKSSTGIQRLYYGKFEPYCDEMNDFIQCQRSINSKLQNVKIGYLTSLLLAMNQCRSVVLELIIKDC